MKHAFSLRRRPPRRAARAAAHHSDSLYFIDDRSADGGAIRIEGTVSRVRWINPHSEFFVDVPSATGGEPTVWAIETDSVNQLRALGWDDNTLKSATRSSSWSRSRSSTTRPAACATCSFYGATAAEPAAVYLEYKPVGEQWEAPLKVYQRYSSCPGTAVTDANRQPGKETLLCATLTARELAATAKNSAHECPYCARSDRA